MIIRPQERGSFAEAAASVIAKLQDFSGAEASKGRCLVFVRFFLSDAQNQAGPLRKALGECGWTDEVSGSRDGGIAGPAISIVEQPPLDGSRIVALAASMPVGDSLGGRCQDGAVAPFLFHSLRLTEEEAAGLDSYGQSRLLFDKYLDLIRPLGLELKTHCVRTWIYVRDIDSNYAGLVKARNDVFAQEGLSHDTHYIASTGIGGASEVRSAVVAMDFLTCPGIAEGDKTYLKALSHLSPTHDYGVAFERGVRLGDRHIFISGTASIDHRGHILNEGDVLAQAGRLLENIEALLGEGGATLGQVPYFVVYLRDISDFAVVDAYMARRFPDVPRVILEARVCRPGWLIEMECEIPGGAARLL